MFTSSWEKHDPPYKSWHSREKRLERWQYVIDMLCWNLLWATLANNPAATEWLKTWAASRTFIFCLPFGWRYCWVNAGAKTKFGFFLSILKNSSMWIHLATPAIEDYETINWYRYILNIYEWLLFLFLTFNTRVHAPKNTPAMFARGTLCSPFWNHNIY